MNRTLGYLNGSQEVTPFLKVTEIYLSQSSSHLDWVDGMLELASGPPQRFMSKASGALQIKILGHFLVDTPQEAQEFLMPVTRLALGDHLHAGYDQSGKQIGGVLAQSLRQKWLSSVKCLDLRSHQRREQERFRSASG